MAADLFRGHPNTPPIYPRRTLPQQYFAKLKQFCQIDQT